MSAATQPLWVRDESRGYEIYCGRWQDTSLATATFDTLIADLPFSERTHRGHNRVKNLKRKRTKAERTISKIDYDAITPDDVRAFVAAWSPRITGWMVCLSSHDMWPFFEEAYIRAGRMVFQPVPCIISGMTCRMSGDGPSSEAVYAMRGAPMDMELVEIEGDQVYAMVARPRTLEMVKWGTLPGWYGVARPGSSESEQGGGRGKPLELIRRLVHDYSRPGGHVVDPTMGYGTTGKACVGMGRRFSGGEVKPEVFALAAQGLALVPPALPLYDPRHAKQAGLFAGEDVPLTLGRTQFVGVP